MFYLSYMAPAEVKGTIQVSCRPNGLGPLTDVKGRRWNIGAIVNDYVCACPENELHPYYTDTSGAAFGLVQQRWNPYRIEVVK